MSRLLYEIERNEVNARKISNAIEDIEMIQVLQPDAFSAAAFSVAIDCMTIQRTRLLSHVSKLKALQESPVKDAVVDALKRQRADLSGYDVVADAVATVNEYEEVRF